jgi:hypothetical protein
MRRTFAANVARQVFRQHVSSELQMAACFIRTYRVLCYVLEWEIAIKESEQFEQVLVKHPQLNSPLSLDEH